MSEKEIRDNPGAPTKYRPEYCELIKKHCMGGNSVETFGAVCNPVVSKNTIANWCQEWPEFLGALNEARVLCELYYENLGKTAMTTGKLSVKNKDGKEEVVDQKFAQAAWISTMSNRFGWMGKQTIEHTGKGGGPIRTLHDYTKDELEKELTDVETRLANAAAPLPPSNCDQEGDAEEESAD